MNRLKIAICAGLLAGTISVMIPGTITAPAAAPKAAAASGCTSASASLRDYYIVDGVSQPHTSHLQCYQLYNPGYWVRVKVTCSFGDIVWSTWIKTLTFTEASCGPGRGYLVTHVTEYKLV